MIVTKGEKQYRIDKLAPSVGRKLMVRGALPTRGGLLAWCRADGRRFLQATGCVSVIVQGDRAIPLMSYAIIDNHVPDRETLLELVWSVIELSFPDAELLAGEPVTIWSLAESMLMQCFDELEEEFSV